MSGRSRNAVSSGSIARYISGNYLELAEAVVEIGDSDHLIQCGWLKHLHSISHFAEARDVVGVYIPTRSFCSDAPPQSEYLFI